MPRIFTACAALAAILSLAAPSAMAQEASPPAAVQPSASYDDAKLESFAVAYLEVGRIVQQAQPRLEATKDAGEQEAIRQEANAAMVAAVEEADGITIEEYTNILASAQTNPDLAQRINTIVQQKVQDTQ